MLKKEKKEGEGKKFKIIVDHGELYFECIDSFEEIFEIKKSMVEDVELTNLLDPYLFDNHRDIVNALFEVYYNIGDVYLEKFYNQKDSTKIRDEAVERVEKKYGIGRYQSLPKDKSKGDIVFSKDDTTKEEIAKLELLESKELL